MTWGPYNGNANQRTTTNMIFRARGYITADVRNQTAYGTVRGYLAVGLNSNDAGLQVANLIDSANRGFVQWAGMTAGLVQSFYDYYNVPISSYRGGYFPASDTGDGGWWVWAYTAQLGGGFSATISEEARRTTQIIYQGGLPGGAAAAGTIVPGSYISAVAGGAAEFPGVGAYGGQQMGDIVANLRVDQAWGGAQLMGALHEVNASYYGSTGASGSLPGVAFGHPQDTWCWAAGIGLRVNTGGGDFFQAQGNVTQGALRYIFQTPNTNWGFLNGGREAYGVLSDCVYGGAIAGGTQTSCHLTSAWGFNAAYEHYWNDAWHTSLFGSYYQVSYDALANAMLCVGASPTFGNNTIGAGAVAAAGCNNNWSTWTVGTRTQWDITKTFYLGVEIMYQNLHSATTNTGTVGGYGFGGAALTEANAGSWNATIRAHRDFLP